MRLIKKSVRIHAPREKIFAYVTLPQNLLNLVPSLVEINHTRRGPGGNPSYDWVVKLGGVPFKGHSDTVKVIPNTYVETRSDSGIFSIYRWSFVERRDVTGSSSGAGHRHPPRHDPHVTEVNLEQEYEVPIPVLGKFAESALLGINERELRTVLVNLKHHLETPDPKASRPRPEARI